MSSILNALKKLENEKTARRPDSLNIDSDILRSDRATGYSALRFVVTALLLFGGGASATYLYMKRGDLPTQKTVVKTESAVPQGGQSFPSPPLPEPNKRDKAESLTSAETVVSLPRPANNTVPTLNKATPLKPVSVQPAALSPSNKPIEKTPIKVESSVVPAAPAIQSPAMEKKIPALKVDGIAFQDGRDTAAIINGTPVFNGSTIDGVTVEDIQKDKVRFNYKGETFTIQLGKSNYAATP